MQGVRRPVGGAHLSEMSVAKAASLARMLQERAEPSRLFLSAFLAMILQMLRTGGGGQEWGGGGGVD